MRLKPTVKNVVGALKRSRKFDILPPAGWILFFFFQQQMSHSNWCFLTTLQSVPSADENNNSQSINASLYLHNIDCEATKWGNCICSGFERLATTLIAQFTATGGRLHCYLQIYLISCSCTSHYMAHKRADYIKHQGFFTDCTSPALP